MKMRTPNTKSVARFFRLGGPLLFAAIFLLVSASARAQSRPQIESGFNRMYELKFDQARADFTTWERAHPDDPMGSTAIAASYLFQELNQKGVLTSAFFLNDKKFLGGADGSPDPTIESGFLQAVGRARGLAAQRFKSNPKDVDGWYTYTLTDGMQSNYAEIIAKHQLEALHYLRASEDDAAHLLAVKPDALDAYVALGCANFVLGSLPGYKRAFLWIGGIHGDTQRGMDQMRRAADGGHYLQPFAKVMLALGALRQHQPDVARQLFGELTRQFPTNPVFAHEYALATQNGPGPCQSSTAPNGRAC
jgi:hypothetical protein